MKKNITIIILLLIAITAVLIAKQNPQARTAAVTASRGIPMLLDLGSGKCVPCKMMKPILEELEAEFTGKMDVVFIDIQTDKEAAGKYDIRIIPTQIFFGADGTELFRHEGFLSKEDLLSKWNELGVDLSNE